MKNWMHTLSRLGLSLVIVLTMLGTAASPTSTADETGIKSHRSAELPTPPQDIPAPPTGGPRPTLTLDPNHGYFGQSVMVSGQGVAPYPGVRLAWLTGDSTLTAAVVNVGAAQAFSATLTVPADAAPGPAKICAAVTGTAMAEFACADFTIDTPPPGSVQGQLPLAANAAMRALDAQAFNASFILRNNSGTQVASTPIQQNGSFAIAQVPPGTYQGTVVGSLPALVWDATVNVGPGEMTVVKMPPGNVPLPGDPNAPKGRTCDASSGVTPTVTAHVTTAPITGTYIGFSATDPAVEVTFEALPQMVGNTTVVSMTFAIVRPDKSEVVIGIDTDSADGWRAAYNVSRLPPGESYLVIKPFPSSGCGEWNSQKISLIANPIADPLVRDGQILWNSSLQRYDFSGTLPDIAGVLPIVYPNPPPDLPLLGTLENKLDAGIHFEGSLGLDRKVRLQIMRPYALARLLGLDIYNHSIDLPPAEMTGPAYCLPNSPPAACWSQVDWQSLRVNYKVNPLYEYNKEVPVFSAPLVTFWGIVTVNASVSVGIGGKLILEGWIYPLAPRLESTLTPEVSAYLKVSIWVDILLGVVSAGADATAQVTVGMPLNLDTAASPPVWLGDPYLQIRVYLDLWARVNTWFWKKKWNLASYELLNYSTGGANVSAQEANQGEPPPRVMASPSVASGPDGRMLSAYIEDTTPAVLTPTMQLMARLWITQTGAWGTPTPLTDGSHAVNDPAVAFVGPDGHALAAWSENTMTQAEDEAAGDDMSTILARQEIYTAYWNGTAWGAPQRLTDDTLSDGRAAMAGDALGATLAWVRDTDGNISTRSDWRIAVTHWNTATLQWGPVELLDGVTATTGTTRQSMRLAPSVRSDDPSRLATESVTTSNAPAAELHVCDTCPYTNIQAAVDAANPGDVIKVAAGIYAGVQRRSGVTQTVYISKTITVHGGYTATNWTTPDPVANPTTLDAQGKGRVLYITGNISPTIEGLRIMRGNATGLAGSPWSGDAGGGVYIVAATATFSNNQVFNNAAYYGGGMYLYNSRATVGGNTVISNTAQHSGGGLHLYSSPATVSGNTIASNTAPVWGGGVYLYSSAALFSTNTIISNTTDYGGGVCLSSSAATFSDNTITSNAAHENGGGVYLYSSAATLNANAVTSNTAGWGGGVNLWYSPAALSGNAIAFNTAQYDGGGLSLYQSNATLTNNVVADNRGSRVGSGVYVQASFPCLLHTTIARNAGGNGSGIYVTNDGASPGSVALTNTILVSHTVGINVTGGNTATINSVLWFGTPITVSQAPTATVIVQNSQQGDPAFAADGYHLTIDSAAIDRGVNAGVTTDIDGDVRPQRAGFDLGADEWGGWMNAQVSVARNSGEAALAWTVDADSELTTNGDRRLAVACCSNVTCTIELPNGLPWGADSPSITFRSPDELQVAFLVRGKDGDGVTDTGIGNQAVLWTAQYATSGWTAAPVQDEQGVAVHAEQPRLSASVTGESLLLFRRFGDMGTNGALGQLALTQSSSGGLTRPPLYLTDEPAQHWQPALAINQATQRAAILNVKRPVMVQSAALVSRPLLASASTAARPTVESVTLAASSDPVESLALEPGADPALDPSLTLSQQHATPSSTVIVTATVRNVGRGAASGLSVRLYAGTPTTGTLLTTMDIPVSLGFNERYTVTFAVTTTTGTQPLVAQITTTGSDLNSANNVASADLGELPPPTFVNVTPSSRYSDTLEITWIAPTVSGVAGYRILRGEISGGSYELVGEATGATFSDVMLERDQRYYYVVQAYDASGIRSVYSAEANGLLPLFRVYLPLMLRP